MNTLTDAIEMYVDMIQEASSYRYDRQTVKEYLQRPDIDKLYTTLHEKKVGELTDVEKLICSVHIALHGLSYKGE